MIRSLMLAVFAGLLTLTPGAFAQDDDPADEGTSAAQTGGESAPAVAQASPMTDSFSRQIGTMEEQVNTLKEQVFRSKVTLQLLKEIVIHGANSGSRSSLTHTNKLGRSYVVESVSYYLDGQSLFSRFDPQGAVTKGQSLEVWEGAIPPGQHQLTVSMVLRGNGFKVFNYVEGYSFKVQSSFTFTAEEGHSTGLTVVVDEKRGVGVPYTERPQVKFELNKVQLVQDE